jgi:hypothetical protein
VNEITAVKARQMAEAVAPQVAIAKNSLGAWCVTLTDAELARLVTKAINAQLVTGTKVSIDVSTGDSDAAHRIFGTVDVVQDGVILAIEDSRNF